MIYCFPGQIFGPKTTPEMEKEKHDVIYLSEENGPGSRRESYDEEQYLLTESAESDPVNEASIMLNIGRTIPKEVGQNTT